MVAAEMALILEIQTDEFWQDITLPMLETVRRRLRALVKLIEYKKRILVYSDFEDSTGAGSEIAVPGISVGTDMDAFRRKARLFGVSPPRASRPADAAPWCGWVRIGAVRGAPAWCGRSSPR